MSPAAGAESGRTEHCQSVLCETLLSMFGTQYAAVSNEISHITCTAIRSRRWPRKASDVVGSRLATDVHNLLDETVNTESTECLMSVIRNSHRRVTLCSAPCRPT